MNRAISVADIRTAIDTIEAHAHGAGVDDETERSAHLFHVLEDVRNIRALLAGIELPAGPDYRGMVAATQGKSVES